MGILKDFNGEAGGQEEGTAFLVYLRQTFDQNTAQKVAESFQKLGLPLPQDEKEFLMGTEGGLVFLNRYGMVIRIENSDSARSPFKADRINDSPWILQPLASIDAGKAIIELCPGCHFNDNSGDTAYLHDALLKEGHAFWDGGLDNVGLLPVKTPRFPEGIPIVIDRLAVRKLTESIDGVRLALLNIEINDDEIREAAEAQERLYAPLRRAFDEGWLDKGKMPRFWALCRECVQEGKLVAGWNEGAGFWGGSFKTSTAIESAKHYESRLQSWIFSAASTQEVKPPSGGPS
ncbi:MAG: hypothetical protein K8R48_01575 [Alphaproteobacteria bacterium]|nr:hypothetical protein [Alphaproteobacteria bacterium]